MEGRILYGNAPLELLEVYTCKMLRVLQSHILLFSIVYVCVSFKEQDSGIYTLCTSTIASSAHWAYGSATSMGAFRCDSWRRRYEEKKQHRRLQCVLLVCLCNWTAIWAKEG